ncbi:MAG: hypothetical protein IKP41_03460 [Bacteroidaceae bacterium]|nr:hypothetical protein [Bacteroidaceae bacterium]
MKKFALLFLALVGALTVQADETYPYLTFETTDGAKISVNTESLKLTINGTTLTAGDQQFTITNLSKMYFSASDESTTTGMEEITRATLDDATEIYDLQGRKVTKEQMRTGVYIVKTKDRTCKIVVK